MAFNNTAKLYILADLKPSKAKIFSDIRTALNSTDTNTPHVTLFEIVFNADHPLFSRFNSNIFKNFVNQTSLPNITLQFSNYDIKGKVKKFLTATFLVSREDVNNAITVYRKTLYDAIDNMFQVRASKSLNEDNDFVYYQMQRIDLYAVPKYSYGRGIWTPHVSIMNEGTSSQNIKKHLLNNDIDSIIQQCDSCYQLIDYKISVRRDCNVRYSFSKVNQVRQVVPNITDPYVPNQNMIPQQPRIIANSYVPNPYVPNQNMIPQQPRTIVNPYVLNPYVPNPYVPNQNMILQQPRTITNPYVPNQNMIPQQQVFNNKKTCTACNYRIIDTSIDPDNEFCCIKCRNTKRFQKIDSDVLAIQNEYHNTQCNIDNTICDNKNPSYDRNKCYGQRY
jgi:hypothetical protein